MDIILLVVVFLSILMPSRAISARNLVHSNNSTTLLYIETDAQPYQNGNLSWSKQPLTQKGNQKEEESNMDTIIMKPLNVCEVNRETAKDHPAAQTCFIVLYMITFVMAMGGNSFTLHVIRTRFKLLESTMPINIFIANLAVTDILLCLTSLWLTPTFIFLNRWVFGSYSCYIFAVSQGVAVVASSFTLMVIALERYKEINKPFLAPTSARARIGILFLIWFGAIVVVSPYAGHVTTSFSADCGFNVCKEEWPSEVMRKAYGIIVFGLQFTIPAVVIIICYVMVFKQANRQRIPSYAISTSEDRIRRRRRVNLMLISMVLIFAACWVPLNVINFLRDYKREIIPLYMFGLIYLMVHWFAMTSAVWNPLLYAWLNENFRREFATIIRRCMSSTEVLGFNRPETTPRTTPLNDQNGELRIPLILNHGCSRHVTVDEKAVRKVTGANLEVVKRDGEERSSWAVNRETTC